VHLKYEPALESSEAGLYLRLMDFLYHSTLGLRAIKQKKKSKTLLMSRNLASGPAALM